jgi:hypothetical protein
MSRRALGGVGPVGPAGGGAGRTVSVIVFVEDVPLELLAW